MLAQCSTRRWTAHARPWHQSQRASWTPSLDMHTCRPSRAWRPSSRWVVGEGHLADRGRHAAAPRNAFQGAGWFVSRSLATLDVAVPDVRVPRRRCGSVQWLPTSGWTTPLSSAMPAASTTTRGVLATKQPQTTVRIPAVALPCPAQDRSKRPAATAAQRNLAGCIPRRGTSQGYLAAAPPQERLAALPMAAFLPSPRPPSPCSDDGGSVRLPRCGQ